MNKTDEFIPWRSGEFVLPEEPGMYGKSMYDKKLDSVKGNRVLDDSRYLDCRLEMLAEGKNIV